MKMRGLQSAGYYDKIEEKEEEGVFHMKILVWNEYRHEFKDEKVHDIYPDGIHNTIAAFLRADGHEVLTATLCEENCGLSEALLDSVDVLIWWGHMCHGEVPDAVAALVQKKVLEGMGFIALHSAHHSKPFKLLMGTSCNLSWREDGDYELLWAAKPSHPIAQGIDRYFKIAHEETYGEPFDIPEPDETVFISSYAGGEVFRAGLCFYRGNGRIFYFQPGHETYPIYHDENVQRVIKNAVLWAKPTYRAPLECPHVKKITL